MEGCEADWTHNGHGGIHLLHSLPGDGVLVATMILAVAELLTVAELLIVTEFSVIEGVGWEIVISLA